MRKFVSLHIVEGPNGYTVHVWRHLDPPQAHKRRSVAVVWVPASEGPVSPPELLEAVASQLRLPVTSRPHPSP